MPMSFEELWEKCESFQKGIVENDADQSIIETLLMKINLYKMIDTKTEIKGLDRQQIKTRTMGEILLSLTAISLKDEINVYEALASALQYRLTE